MTKNKHDHTATKKIKAWLFAIMLLLPFLFLLPTGLYYGLNQNAQLSERTVTTNNYYSYSGFNEDITYEFDELQPYTFYDLNFNFGNANLDFDFDYIIIGETISYTEIYANNNGNQPNIKYDYQNQLLEISTNDNYYYYENITPQSYWIEIYFAVNETQIDNYLNFTQNINSYTIMGIELDYLIPNGTNSTTTYTNDISTSIINAWNSTWQNPLFSWTNYSPFYAPMQSFTNVFGINDMQIANVLTYLATITAIYIVFDIVIELFTYLTHLIPRSD